MEQSHNHPKIKRIVSKDLTKPLPIYSHAVIYHESIYISAVQGFVPGTFEFPQAGVTAEAEQMMINLSVILNDAGSNFDRLLKITLYFVNLKDDFLPVNEIVNKYISENSPARSSIEVSGLPRGARVVIDCVAAACG